MKKTAKLTISALLSLVMVMSSLVLVGITGSAEAPAAQVIEPTASILNYGGSTVTQSGNDYSTSSSNSSGKTSVNAFFQHDALKTLSSGDTLQLGMSFTLETTGETSLPSLSLRLYPLVGGGSGSHTFLSFNAKSNAVQIFENGTARSICTYGDSTAHEIYIDLAITWAVGTYGTDASGKTTFTLQTAGKIKTSAYVDGALVLETESTLNIADTKNTNENGINLSGSLTAGGSDMSMKDLTFYTGMPKVTPVSGVAPTGVKNVMGGSLLTMQTVDGKQQILLAGSASGSPVCGFFTGVPGLNDLRGLSGTDVAVSKLGFSFTVAGTPSESGKYPDYSIRLYRKGAINCYVLSFSAAGDVSVITSANKIASLADGPLDVYLDMDITWASAEGTLDGSLTVRAYVNGVYCGEFSTAHKMYETKRDTSETALQFYRSANLTADNGRQVFSDVEFYFGGIANSFEGASMRLTSDASSSGLRFTYGVDKTFFDGFAGARIGALIIPTDKLPNGFSETVLASLTRDKDYIELTDVGFCETAAEADEDTYVYYVSLINLKEKNYARSFTGIGFIELADGRRIYTEAQSRSIYEVARNATASGDYEGSENESRIDRYLDKVVSLDASFAVEQIANYSCDLVGAAAGEGFTLTGSNASKISTVILDGVIYTGGWTVEGNVLTVAKSTPKAE